MCACYLPAAILSVLYNGAVLCNTHICKWTFFVILAFQRSKRKVANVYLTYLCHTCRTWLSSVLSPRLHCCNIPTPRPPLIYLHFSMYTALCRFLRDEVINMLLVRKTEPVLYLSSTLAFLPIPAGESSHCRSLNHYCQVDVSTGTKLSIGRVISHPCMKEIRTDSTMLVTSWVMIPSFEVTA